MSFNGSGTFNINSAGQPVVSGTTITSTAFNALTTDLGNGLSNVICKDGQTTTTQPIPFAAGVTIGGASLGGNALAVTGNVLFNGQVVSNFDGENRFAFLTCSGDSGTAGYFKSTGFGFTATYDISGITTSLTSGLNMVCVSNGVTLASGATSWSAISDERLKTDLVPITNALEKVCRLRACTGRYKTDDPSVSRSFLIAQDVKKMLPEAVKEDGNGILHLAITDVIPLLVGALKDAHARIQVLENVVLQG